MSRARAALPLVALLVAAMVVQAPTASAAGGNNGAGGFCVQGPSQVIVDYATPRPVGADVTGSGSVNCPAPQAAPGGAFGRPNTVIKSAQPGAACTYTYAFPAQFRMVGGAYQIRFPTQPVGNPPGPVAVQGADWTDLATLLKGFGWPGPITQEDQGAAGAMYRTAGTSDFEIRFTFRGHTDATGRCAGDPQLGWTNGCNIPGGDAWPACIDQVAPTAPVVAGPPGPGFAPQNLNALVQGNVTGGTIRSLPDAAQNHPGLTNLPTCFYVSGMHDAVGQPLDVQRPLVLQQVVVGPLIGDPAENRHVIYVFRITVRYVQATVDFGDGSPPGTALAASARNPGGAPQPCLDDLRPADQLLVTHTYLRYSTGAGWPVRVTHQFGVDLDVFWSDAAGTFHPQTQQNVVPPVNIDAQPIPFSMRVVQEMGIPIGG